MDIVSAFFEVSRFMPHGMCFLWRWDLLALHVGSDMAIAGAYFSIPAAMLVLIRKRPDIPKGIFKLFVAFIMLCGITHVASIIVIWYPAYYIEGLFKLATAVVSIITAVVLWPLIPKAIEMPSIQQMEKRNREIIGLNKKLQQRVDSLSTLAGGVSHEFNNLLTIINGNTELMLMQEDHKNDRQLIAIQNAANRATSVCSKMLAFSGHGHFMMSEVSINNVIRNLDLNLPETIAVSYELESHLDPINASPRQLEQLVDYLCSNAVEAIEAGKRPDGLVVIRTFSANMTRKDLDNAAFEHTLQPGAVVMLEIRDNGTGMSDEVRERLFEPYFTTKFIGRGLGMSAVQGIVRGHGACMFMRSEEGQGSVFGIAFPAIVKTTTRYRAPTIARPEVVLVVDDEADILELAKSYLGDLDIDVLTATNGEDALKLVRANQDRLEAVILDYLMPTMTGVELLHEIAAVCTVDTYLTSGYTRGEISNPEVQESICGFIAKPFMFDDFKKLFRPDKPGN